MSIKVERLTKYILIIFILILIVPHVQKKLNLFNEKELIGAVVRDSSEALSIKTWLSGLYQEKKEESINSSFGFRKTLIRLNNQVNFSLFRSINSTGTKMTFLDNGSIIEVDAINSYLGLDKLPDSTIVNKFKLLEFVQDELKKRGVNLILALMPSKAYFDSTYIPYKYKVNKQGCSNYNFIKSHIDNYNINFIDLGSVLHDKNYPIYPKYSGHWSSYAMYVAMDTISKRVKEYLNYEEYGLRLLDYEVGKKPINRENDLGELCNLLIEPKEGKYIRPIVEVYGQKPWTLLIGDSFFANIIQEEKYDGLFRNIRLWYYFNTEYAEKLTYRGSLDALKSNPESLLNEVCKYSTVIVIQTDVNNNLGFEFFEEIYKSLNLNK